MGKEVLGSELEANKKTGWFEVRNSRFSELRTLTLGLRIAPIAHILLVSRTIHERGFPAQGHYWGCEHQDRLTVRLLSGSWAGWLSACEAGVSR